MDGESTYCSSPADQRYRFWLLLRPERQRNGCSRRFAGAFRARASQGSKHASASGAPEVADRQRDTEDGWKRPDGEPSLGTTQPTSTKRFLRSCPWNRPKNVVAGFCSGTE